MIRIIGCTSVLSKNVKLPHHSCDRTISGHKHRVGIRSILHASDSKCFVAPCVLLCVFRASSGSLLKTPSAATPTVLHSSTWFLVPHPVLSVGYQGKSPEMEGPLRGESTVLDPLQAPPGPAHWSRPLSFGTASARPAGTLRL